MNLNRYHVAAVITALAGIAFLIYAAIKGQGSAGICLVFPFYIGTGIYSAIGILLIMAAFFLFFFATVHSIDTEFVAEAQPVHPPPEEIYTKGHRSEIKGGGVIFIGPVPIVFGTDTNIAGWMLIVAAVITGIIIAFYVIVYLGVI